MDVAIVGAGLSGLTTGITLQKLGHTVQIFEAQDSPGGRVQSTVVDGHIVDKGFQILLTAYPFAKELLDYTQLDVRNFAPGALIRTGGDFHKVGDPFREPAALWSTFRSPVGSIADKLRILAFRRSVLKGTVDDIWEKQDMTTAQLFQSFGFSSQLIDRFLRPLFSGITLDPLLQGSANTTRFIFRMLSTGLAAVPANGMGEISKQLATKLPEDTIVYNTPVRSLSETELTFSSGEKYTADAIVLATDVSTASAVTNKVKDMGWKGTTSIWFKAPESPIAEPRLVLNGESSSTINSFAPLSQVSSTYGSDSAATMVASAPGIGTEVREGCIQDLQRWFGSRYETWKILEVQEIERAQPLYPATHAQTGTLQISDRAWATGDYLTNSSINGALEAGTKTAYALHTALENP